MPSEARRVFAGSKFDFLESLPFDNSLAAAPDERHNLAQDVSPPYPANRWE